MPRSRPPDKPNPRRVGGDDAEPITNALNAAASHYGAGRLDQAAELYQWVQRRQPYDIRPLYSLAVIELRRKQFESARRRLKAVLRRQPDHYPAAHNLGVVEQSTGAWVAAVEAYRRAAAIRPEAAESRFSLAVAEAVTGGIDAAVAIYRSLAADPSHAPRALSRLAILRPGAIDDSDLAVLSNVAFASDDEDRRIEALFAVGGVKEARGDDDGAWRAFEIGNALKHDRLERGPDTARPSAVGRAQAEAVTRLRTLYTADFLAANAGQGDPAAKPIFILGMPRSGSSLIEQILSSHPQVRGMGESDALADTVVDRFPQDAAAKPEPPHFRRLARDYLARQSARGWDGRSRLVDKTLDNHLQVGLIHLMFPKATILIVRRDPLDVGVACFRQLFAAGNETLYGLQDIAAEIRRYEAVMDHWRRVLPGRVFEVRYETLVAEPEAQIRRLITQGCVLPWSPNCLEFHRADSVVATASAEQVRRPIFAASVGRWRRYDRWLDPFRQALRAEP